MKIKDRITELRRVKASELRPNPKNWRKHPLKQQNALRALLAEIGFAGAALAREMDDGTLMLIDGHLRAETTPESEIPVLVLDVSEEESDKILASYDQVTYLAEADEEALKSLLDSVSFEHEAIKTMFADLAAEREEEAAEKESKTVAVPESWQVVIDCTDEDQQRAVYEQLTEEGLSCRLLTL